MNFFAMSANESKKCTCCEVKHSMNFIMIVYETSGQKNSKRFLDKKRKIIPLKNFCIMYPKIQYGKPIKQKKIWKPKPVVSNHILKCYR